MRKNRSSLFKCGIAVAAAGLAVPGASAGEVNISGATLLRPFFQAPASTNDFIDADGDGCSGFADPDEGCGLIDQLAPAYMPGGAFAPFWQVQYRGVGSVNGLKELLDFHACGVLSGSVPAERGYLNRFEFASGGQRVGSGPFADCNQNGLLDDSGTPVCPSSVDLAILDVESKWGVAVAGEAAWNLSPAAPGYGLNSVISSTGYVSSLQQLNRDCTGDGTPDVFFNTNTSSPDARTLFDSRIAWAPVVYIANRGTGLENVHITDLQSLMVTGRMPNGENLVAATRSVGSGTRNAIMNTSGIDPSWGMGDNEGNEEALSSLFNLGPNTRASNAEGSSGIEGAVRAHRLGVGYTGLAGTDRAASDAANGQYEILNVMFDDRGGAQFVRPSVDTILDNADPNTGYQIGGNASFVTVGYPSETDAGSPAYMANQAAASYLRNISASVVAFISAPSDVANVGMPGEYLATTFFGVAGLDALPDPSNPSHFIDQTATAGFNQSLQDFIRSNNTTVTPAYGAINSAGQVPNRNVLTGGATYSDGSANGDYINPATGLPGIQRNKKLNERNRTAGDFNYAGAEKHRRNLNDVAKMMEAVKAPRAFETVNGMPINHGGSAGDVGGDYVIPEIIGDFDGDGNFDAADIRYFGDGLAIDPATGKLDRKQGFALIDQNWAVLTPGDGNYFDTVLATAKPYEAGAARADIAGATARPNPGGRPAGSDGLVNAADIDWVCENIHFQVKVGGLGFVVRPGRTTHVLDLSADVNGDLLIDSADLEELVQVILGTEYGDVNLDGRVDATDEAVINANLLTAGGWAAGDLTCDGQVTAADHDVWAAHNGFVAAYLCVSPTVVSAVSRKTHGPAGAFDIALDVTGVTAAVEPRAEGVTELVLKYDRPIAALDGLLDSEVVLSSGRVSAMTVTGETLTIAMTGVAPVQCLTVSVDGISCVGGGPVTPLTLKVRVNQGDVTGDGLVASADITQVKARSGQDVTAENFTWDVNADGVIASADITQVKARSGNDVSCP